MLPDIARADDGMGSQLPQKDKHVNYYYNSCFVSFQSQYLSKIISLYKNPKRNDIIIEW